MDWEAARYCPNSLINADMNQPGQATTEEILYLVEYNLDSGHVQSSTSSMVHFSKT